MMKRLAYLVMGVLLVLPGCSRHVRQVTNTASDPVVTPTPTTQPTVIPSLDIHPVAVRGGMTTAEALTHLDGFTSYRSADRTDERLEFRRPWQGGYHFVWLDVSQGRVVKVSEIWNDP